MGDPVRQVPGRHRFGNAITLGALTAQLQQHLAMGDGFHALGNDLPAKGLGQSDDALQDGQVVHVAEHAADKTLVDLEQVDAQAAQVGQ